MAALSLLPNPLKWTGDYYNREALWPAEPDIIVIRSLAIKHLASELPNTADLVKVEVQFFAQGGFNKLYSISFPGHGTSYLFRVALPLVPYYKIESEAAMLSYLKENTNFDVNDWSSDCEQEAPELEKLTLDFQGVLPEVFPDTEEVSPYILYHHDLSLASILVNPATFEITGIIDWEKIHVVPEWKASRFPKFLKYQIDFEEMDDKEPRMPTPAECEKDGESHNPVVAERRDRWDNKILRQHYDEALSRTRVEDHFPGYMRDSAKTKREFEEQVWDITEGARSARTWLEERSENHQ